MLAGDNDSSAVRLVGLPFVGQFSLHHLASFQDV